MEFAYELARRANEMRGAINWIIGALIVALVAWRIYLFKRAVRRAMKNAMACRHEGLGFVEEGFGWRAWKRCLGCGEKYDERQVRGVFGPAIRRVREESRR